jgi:hypothetical protein
MEQKTPKKHKATDISTKEMKKKAPRNSGAKGSAAKGSKSNDKKKGGAKKSGARKKSKKIVLKTSSSVSLLCVNVQSLILK